MTAADWLAIIMPFLLVVTGVVLWARHVLIRAARIADEPFEDAGSPDE